MSILFEQLLEALDDSLDEICEENLEEEYTSARPNTDTIYSLIDKYNISSNELLDDLLRFLPDSALEDFAGYISSMYEEYNDLAFNESLNENISDRGEVGPKVLAKLEDLINTKTKFKLDTDPDGKVILTDSKQLQFRVDIDNNNNIVLLDSKGKVFIKDSDPENFIKKVIVFITD